MGVAMPQNISLPQWAGIINASDYFLGCDSVGQHISYAINKPSTIVVGSTYPENISYPNEKNFYVIDNAKNKRKYSPIRMALDESRDRNNEDLMVLSDDKIKEIIKSIKDKIGVSKVSNETLKLSGLSEVSEVSKLNPMANLPITNFNGFQKPKSNKKKPIEQLLELNEIKS
jgi:hypothetical protein